MKVNDILQEAFKLSRLDSNKNKKSPPDESDDFDFDTDLNDTNSSTNDELDLDIDIDTDDEDAIDDELDLDVDIDNVEDTLPDQTIDDMVSDEPNLNASPLGNASVSTPTDDPFSDDSEEGSDPDEEGDTEAIDSISDKALEDPNKQGLLRKVEGARLVYKRQGENGTFDELWVYNTGRDKYRDSIKIRKAVLAGTDIPPGKTQSPDGSQSYEVWASGNAEVIKVSGLPN